MRKQELLREQIRHVELDSFDPRPLVEQMKYMAFSARDLHRAAEIYDRMLKDDGCSIILCLAGSLVSAGLREVLAGLVRNNMVDAIVSTGANIVDQDFLESLGFFHWIGTEELKSGMHDQQLRELGIDRIYDTLLNEDDLRVCDDTIAEIADSLEPGPMSSRQFIAAMGQWLLDNGKTMRPGIVLEAYRKGVPIFCPAFSDCSAGFGLVSHRAKRAGGPVVAIDSAADFHELTEIKMQSKETALLMVGGGVPKNFAQDIVVAAEILQGDATMHKYAIQITVADVRDGALSGSTLKEACSWGKVDTTFEQMVYSEATLALPLIAGYAFHNQKERGSRRERKLANLFASVPVS